MFRETTESAIEACEEAWEFYGGIFHVLIPDNTKAIVTLPDPLGARINHAFLEYAQARAFHIDPARVRSPRDKARVERTVPTVRDDCFGGELVQEIARVDEACATALAFEMHDVRRLEHMLKNGTPTVSVPAPTNVIPLARYLRPASQYALPLASRELTHLNHHQNGEET